MVVEQGYYYPGDGGGRIWFMTLSDTSSIDTDGTAVVPGGVYGDMATAGCWHGFGEACYGHGINDLNQCILRLPWFGGIANETDISTAWAHAVATLTNNPGIKAAGAIYLPSGTYRASLPLVADSGALGSNVAITVFGDGPLSTQIAYGLTAPATALLTFSNWSGGCLRDIGFTAPAYAGLTQIPSTLRITAVTVFTVDNVQMMGLNSTGNDLVRGGTIQVDNGIGEVNTLTLSNVVVQGGTGCKLYQQHGSIFMTGCKWSTGDNSQPCIRIEGCNSNEWTSNFCSGGGPARSYPASLITSTATTFTMQLPATHKFVQGSWLLIQGAAHAAYNATWRVASVTGTSATVTSAINPGNDSATVSTLWSSIYIAGPYGGDCTESQFSKMLVNDSGAGLGSVGVYIDGISDCGAGGLTFESFVCDYGRTAFFAQGQTYQAANVNAGPVFGSSVGGLRLRGFGPNGGPANDFGCIRLEGVTDVEMSGGQMFPGNGNPPLAGTTYNCLVISDGGQSYYTQDIIVNGTELTCQHSSQLYPNATAIYGVQLDGANVKRVSIMNVGLDTTTSYAHDHQLTNGGTWGTSVMMFRRDDGRLVVNDSTGVNRAL